MEKVFANGESVATMGTDHIAVNDGSEFDELLISPKHTQEPTLNVAYMPTLVGGSTKVFFGGSLVWTVGGTLATSTEYHTEPPASVGLSSGQPYRGVATCLKGSDNVFVEGRPVVRHNDPTTQDNGNSAGKVLMKSDLDRLKAALDAEIARRAAKAPKPKPKGGTGHAGQTAGTGGGDLGMETALDAKRKRRAQRQALIDGARAKAKDLPPGPERDEALGQADALSSDMKLAERAMLANDVYFQPRGDPPQAPPGYEIPPGGFVSRSSGEQSALYRSLLEPNTTILAFRGTELEGEQTALDWLANLTQGVGFYGPQYNEALNQALAAYARYGSNLQIVGHSLGGGLAGLAGLATGRPTTTFNAAGVHTDTLQIASSVYGITPTNGSNIDAYHLRGEILTSLQQARVPVLLGLTPFLGPIATSLLMTGGIPQAPGRSHEIMPHTEQSLQEGRGGLMNPGHAINLHDMRLTILEIEERKKESEAGLSAFTGLPGLPTRPPPLNADDVGTLPKSIPGYLGV